MNNLTKYFKNKKVLLAYSGGTDSTALLHILSTAPGVDVEAITIKGQHIPEREFKRAVSFCKKFDISHTILKVDILKIDGLMKNDKNRCYYCKKKAFSLIKEEGEKINADIIVDGTNIDDKGDYRPGMTALKELNIFSPFLEFGMGKKEIYNYLKKNHLDEFIQPSNACLISRVAYGRELTEEILEKIDSVEEFLKGLGFKQSRLRIHDNLVRLEIKKDKFPLFFKHIDEITEELKRTGLKFITFDLEGYRTGSLNPEKKN